MKKIILFIAILFAFELNASAQSASTIFFNTGNNNLPAVGTNFNVPVNVTGFDTDSMPNQITSLIIFLEYDSTVISYTGYTNTISGLDYSVTKPNSNTVEIQVYDWTNGYFSVPDGKLIDLQYDFKGGYSPLTFGNADPTACTYSDENFVEHPIPYLTNGAVQGGMVDNTISGGAWNTATNWSLGVVPNAYHNVTVASGTETTIADTVSALANNVTIAQGGELTNHGTLTIGSNLLVETNATGSGSFIDHGTSSVTGTSSAQCYVTAGQWHGITSPLSGVTFNQMYLGGSPEVWAKSYNEGNDTYSFISDLSTPINDMQGYMTWVGGSSAQTFTFTGSLRTGTVGTANNMVHAGNGFNFVGNPFTSAIDWNATSGWTKGNLNDAIYVYAGSGPTWATYIGGHGTNGGTNNIAMNQGFFVQVNAAGTGTLTMNDSVCVHNAVGYMKSAKVSEKIVRLQVNDANKKDETLIVFNEEATVGYDGAYDAHKLFSFDADYPQIYSTANDFMSINSLPFDAMGSVPLDVRGKDGNSLTISATQAEDFENLYLKDEYTGEVTNLKHSDYTFVYHSGVINRFSLFFSITGVDENATSDWAKIFATHKNIRVVLSNQSNVNVSVYNLLGQMIDARSSNAQVTNIPIEKSGYYVVKIYNGKRITSEKVFIK